MDQHDERRGDNKVRVTAHYTLTADKEQFLADSNDTLAQIMIQAYAQLGQRRRVDDRLLCHAEPRVNLAPHLHETLRVLAILDVCIDHDRDGGHNLEFDIEADIRAP